MEQDNEVKGVGNQLDFGARIYNPRIGKFLSVDPLTQSYPFYSPYHFAGNSPITSIDLDGLEAIDHRILQKLEFGKIKVDMQKAPDFVLNSSGKRVYTTLKGGRKWNAR